MIRTVIILLQNLLFGLSGCSIFSICSSKDFILSIPKSNLKMLHIIVDGVKLPLELQLRHVPLRLRLHFPMPSYEQWMLCQYWGGKYVQCLSF